MISLNTSITGMQSATERLNTSAQKIASAGLPGAAEEPKDVVSSIVDMKQAELAFKANAKAFSITSDTLGSFLDMTA